MKMKSVYLISLFMCMLSACENKENLVINVTSVEVSPSTLNMTLGDKDTLTVSVLPEDATNKDVLWSSSDEDVAIVSADGVVTAVGFGEATITATADEQTGECEIIVEISTVGGGDDNDGGDDNSGNNTPPSEYNDSIVDLGLSVKWASFNVGASRPEDYGGYFAWGEVVEKVSYDDTSYIYNGPLILSPSYDVATVQWGSKWRMPTVNECEELLKECQWSYETYNGVAGYKVTGINGNFIFLPMTGGKVVGSPTYEGYEARYRTLEAFKDPYDGTPSTYILELQRSFEDTEVDYCAGWAGHPVRAVRNN